MKRAGILLPPAVRTWSRPRAAPRAPATEQRDQALRSPVPVDVRRVEERHAGVDRGVQRRQGLRLVGLAPAAADRPRAVADLGDVPAGLPEASRLHARIQSAARGAHRSRRESRRSLRIRPPVWHFGAVVDRVLLEVDLRDRRAAHVAGLAQLRCTRYVFASFAPRSRSSSAAPELGLGRSGQALRPRPGSGPGREGVRGERRGVEDLVRPGAADPRDHALVAEQRCRPATGPRGSRPAGPRRASFASGPRCPSSRLDVLG